MFGLETLWSRCLPLCALACLVGAVSPDCSLPCSCPPELPRCPAGVSLLTDGCGCCRVCAGQLGDECSLGQPCDQHKGLHCHLPPHQSGRQTGICLDRQGATCDLGGVIYRSGETFQPSCKYQCTCLDGAIGCIPFCTDDIRLPSPGCPSPRRVKVPGQCCEEWVCDESRSGLDFSVALPVYTKEVTFGPDSNQLHDNCILQTTEWSACSQRCGMGISTRVTSDNQECRLEKQTRLCVVRPCDVQQEQSIKKGKKCIRTAKPLHSMKFEFSGCSSTKSYRPRFCGVCTDGRCCTPHSTVTLVVEFKCPEGDRIKRKMMFIKSCSCHSDCPSDNDIFQSTFHRKMIGDYTVQTGDLW
ncbi:CCN family member 2-like [Callorhinchus milii]|uniref:CCN family member 2-like n=1 Tax=Callorhinchus milii TaxID=7868 RepID=UPI001C3FBFD6|nr:CCN family member 2-like [Callorhinchus milii]